MSSAKSGKSTPLSSGKYALKLTYSNVEFSNFSGKDPRTPRFKGRGGKGTGGKGRGGEGRGGRDWGETAPCPVGGDRRPCTAEPERFQCGQPDKLFY